MSELNRGLDRMMDMTAAQLLPAEFKWGPASDKNLLKKLKLPKKPKPMLDPRFTAFWAHYPRRDAKADALKAWAALSDEKKDMALKRVVAYAILCKDRERKYIKLPGGWLRSERFDDEELNPVATPSAANSAWYRAKRGNVG